MNKTSFWNDEAFVAMRRHGEEADRLMKEADDAYERGDYEETVAAALLSALHRERSGTT